MWFRLRRAMLYPLRISEHCMNVQNHYAKPSSTFPTTLLSWAPLSAPMFKMGKKRCLWFHCYHSHRRSHRLPRLWLVWNGKPSGTSLPYYPHMNSWTMWDLLPHHQQNKLSKTASPPVLPFASLWWSEKRGTEPSDDVETKKRVPTRRLLWDTGIIVLCACILMFLRQNSISFCSDCHSKAGNVSKKGKGSRSPA